MNGLVEVVVSEMKLRPNDGSLYVFRNVGRDKVKLLIWDRNGFVMGYKRLERGRFDFGEIIEKEVTISWEQFGMLISGMPMVYIGKGVEKETVFS